MKLGGGMGRSVFCGAVLSVLAAAPLAACGDEGGTGGGAGEDGSGGDGAGNGGGTGGGGSENPIASCDDRSTDGTKVSGTISEDTTWSGRVYLESSVTVSGATLTIEPGTVVIAAAGSELSVSAGGAIVSGGTEDDPIAFCGESGDAGLWTGISVAEDAAATSELSYTLVSGAGSGDAALVLDAATLVDHAAVTDSGADGVHASIFAADSTNLTVVGAEGAPAVLTHAAAVSPFPAGGELTGNGDDHVVLGFETADVDMTFAKLSVPYLQPADLEITAGDVEYLAGVIYHLAYWVTLDVGVGAETLRFDVTGTEEEPVKFEGPGAFGGTADEARYYRINLHTRVSPGSLVQHAQFRYASTALSFHSSTLQHVLVEDSFEGMEIAESFSADSSNLLIRNLTGSRYLNLAPNSIFTIPPDTQLIGSDPLLAVSAGTLSVSGTLVDVGIPYFFSSNNYFSTDDGDLPLVIASGVELVVPAGMNIVFGGDAALEVTGKLVVEGTAEQPVTFRNSGATSWSHISIAPDADSSSSFNYVNLVNGNTCLELYQPIWVRNSTFDCAEHSIHASVATYDSAQYTEKFEENDYSGLDPTYANF